jgi:predicted ATPase
MATAPNVFIKRVALRNYRSIAACDVELGSLTFLVGPNGSGKSNFLDALRLIADSLTSSLDHALRDRGGIQEVRRRSSGHPNHFGIRVDFALKDGRDGHYAFEVGARPRGDFIVKEEECVVGSDRYVVREGSLVNPTKEVFPPAVADRLYLVNAAGLPQFRPVFDAFSHMGFYNINPDRIRELQAPDKGEVLRRDGGNLASVTARLEKPANDTIKRRIEAYLGRVVPGVVAFESKRVGHMETIEFRQLVEGSSDAWRFPAINMSDGTLRTLAVLVALFQNSSSSDVTIVGLEEPETALHPAAASVLRDCILEARRHVQIIVTSHSADLLDDPEVPVDSLRAVEATEGKTLVAPVDEAARSALKDRLYTAGELLRSNQLAPDRSAIPMGSQLRLFGDANS